MSHPDDGVLQELLDGELATADEAAVRTHLATCAACTALLEELRATQMEAASIVSRLELDPPLRRAASGHSGLHRVNLRLLGLAASTVLVAGTSWLLLRTSPPADGLRREVADSGRAAELLAGREVRDRPSATATAPGTAPAPAARATGQTAADEKKANADAAPDASGAGLFRQRPKEEVVAPVAAPAPAVVANEPAPVMTIADAESRLGWKVRTIEGLSPQSIELMTVAPDGAPGVVSGVRQRYLVSGVPVVLVQQALVRPGENQVSIRGGRADELASKQRAVTADQAMPAGKAKDGPEGVVSRAAAAPSALNVRSWDSAGVRYELEGALPVDSLGALMRRVR